MPHSMPLVTTIAAAFAAAWLLGLLARRVGLNPIVGYLLAGVAVGPYTPGFVGDVGLAGQLAEIGVVLLMFGVGIHFHPRDLLAVKGVALPGALLQSAAATLLGLAVAHAFGWSTGAGLVLGLALAVASTVVLLRVLEDGGLLDTVPGHVAVGWLIVEDLMTVVVLVLIPVVGGPQRGGAAWVMPLAVALLKLGVLVALVLVAGARLVPFLLEKVAALRSRELFTLTVLALAMAVATGSALFFGVSMALGAFLAGIVVGQSPLSHQAAADALPLRDAFAVLFFVSVGMLFDPALLVRAPLLVLSALAVVMVGKPMVAFVVVAVLGYSVRTALTVGLALAQIGEFSFILAQLGRDQGLLPAEGPQVLVACALVAISLNPIVVRAVDPLEAWLRRRPRLLAVVETRARRRQSAVNQESARRVAAASGPRALVVGYGPVGQAVERLLRQSGLDTVVVDLNPDTVRAISDAGRAALFGDASHPDILRQAGVAAASHLVVTLPHSLNRVPLIMAARAANPALRILVRARYLQERAELQQAGASEACFEETEAAVALAGLVLRDLGTDEPAIAREEARIRAELG